MASSVDGRIVVNGWPADAATAVRREFEAIHASYEADGWICGRVTMEPFARATRSEEDIAREHTGGTIREDFRAPGDFASYAFAVDPRGRLAWTSNDIDGDHVVAIVTTRVSDDYLGFLRAQGVSYVLAGAGDVDLKVALERIGSTFGVRALMLEGGGRLNGSMLRAGLVDEVSLLVAPVADGRIGMPSVIELEGNVWALCGLSLEHVERREGGVVWLRYRVEHT